MMGARGPPGLPGPPVSTYVHPANLPYIMMWSNLTDYPYPQPQNAICCCTCYVVYIMTNCCASSHSTGTSGTHRTPWWAWRAWADCKIILQNIHNSLVYYVNRTGRICYHFPCQTYSGDRILIVEIICLLWDFNALVFFPKGTVGPRGPPGPPGKAGDDVRTRFFPLSWDYFKLLL